jgi:ribosomal protein S18 acetylase RimI-like enzyme
LAVRFRTAGPEDLPLVKRTLYTALSWDPEDPIPPFDTVLAHPDIAVYYEDWMRPGDDGVVAETDAGELAGMAYCRQFDDDEPSQGFVDTSTPELAVGVEPEFRGRGIGHTLIQRLHESRRDAGIQQMSLSVNVGNRAVHLYERLGYREQRRSDDAIVMVVALGSRE